MHKTEEYVNECIRILFTSLETCILMLCKDESLSGGVLKQISVCMEFN